MENAYVLLGLRDSAGPEEIEEAYRNKKQLCSPDRFAAGTPEREFAHARGEALDRAYAYAMAAVFAPRRAENIRALPDPEPANISSGKFSSGDLILILFACPVAAGIMQSLFPSILSDLAPGGIRGGVLFAGGLVVVLSYLLPLLLRFVLLKRPVRSFGLILLCFPATLLTADLFTSILLYFSFVLPVHAFRYIPALYLTAWGPLFMILWAHCAILGTPFVSASGRRMPFFRRLVSCTLILIPALTLSMGVCILANRDEKAAGTSLSAGAASFAVSTFDNVLEEPWQTLELFDAGIMEIPSSWYVEDSNGKHHQVEHGEVVQHIREALVVRPYGQTERGLDYALEVQVYWWTRKSGKILSPSADAPEKVQEQQFDALMRTYPDIVAPDRSKIVQGDRTVSVLTAETRSIPHYIVRFKNLVFEEEGKLCCLTVGYPAGEEYVWEIMLDRILWRWRPSRAQ